MADQPGFTYWKCRECGFDAVTHSAWDDRSPICPICAGVMSGRIARDADTNVEGKDARQRCPDTQGMFGGKDG